MGSDDCGGEFGECDGEEKREKKKYRLEYVFVLLFTVTTHQKNE